MRPYSSYKRSSSSQLTQVDWDGAFREFVGRMKEIQWRHGPESIAVLAPARLTTEEWLMLRTVVEGPLSAKATTLLPTGTMESLKACQAAWDVPSPPGVYDDIETAETILLVGTHLRERHPLLWQRLLNNRLDPTVVVVDSCESETVRWPGSLRVKSGSESELFRGVARILVDQGFVDPFEMMRETDSVSDFLESLQRVELARVSAATGLSIFEIRSLAETIGAADRLSMWWPDDVATLPTDLPSTLINLSLMMPSASRAGGGANPLISPWNVLGMCAAGTAGMTTPESGTGFYSSFDSLLESLEDQKLQAVWILNTNATTLKLPTSIQDSLHELEFVVVQGNAVDAELESVADLILPTTEWGEKIGTFISPERRCGMVSAVTEPPGETLSDHEILVRLLDYWGEPVPGRTPQETFSHLSQLSKGEWWDLTGFGSIEAVQTHSGRQCGKSSDPAAGDVPLSLWHQSDDHSARRPHFIVK